MGLGACLEAVSRSIGMYLRHASHPGPFLVHSLCFLAAMN